MPVPNFDKLNSKIKSVGADWVAGETPYSKFHGRKSVSSMLGLSMTPELAFSSLSQARNAELAMQTAPPSLPKMLDWRTHNGKNWVTSVKDQGSCGSCVAFATISVLESRVLIANNKPGANFDLSEAHLFYCGTPNSCAIGWMPGHALNFAQTNGVGLEKAFPYTPGNQACRPVPAAVRITGHSTAATSSARKTALQKGPVIAAMAIYDDFFSYKSGIYRHVTGSLSGYHAVAVIGYDDTKGCWIAKNSWATTWGDKGFFRIRYGECGMDTQFPFYFPTQVNLQQGVKV